MTEALSLPFTMLVTHPIPTLATLVTMYGACYLPGLVMRRKGR